MKNVFKNLMVVLGAATLTLSSVGCAKETPLELKRTRVDAMKGIIEVDTYFKDGTTSRAVVQGDVEVNVFTIEVDSIKVVSLEVGTKGRVNGWVVDNMQNMDGFTYYPESDELNKEFKFKEVK